MDINIQLILSFAGALAWLPILYQFLKKPKIYTKLIKIFLLENGKYKSKKGFDEKEVCLKGTIFYFTFRILCSYKDLPIKRVFAKVKYKSEKEPLDGEVIYSEYVTINETDISQRKFTDNILSFDCLKKDEEKITYIEIIVDSNKTDLEWVDIYIVSMINEEEFCFRFDEEDFKNCIYEL